jgi:hypothetical protein
LLVDSNVSGNDLDVIEVRVNPLDNLFGARRVMNPSRLDINGIRNTYRQPRTQQAVEGSCEHQCEKRGLSVTMRANGLLIGVRATPL